MSTAVETGLGANSVSTSLGYRPPFSGTDQQPATISATRAYSNISNDPELQYAAVGNPTFDVFGMSNDIGFDFADIDVSMFESDKSFNLGKDLFGIASGSGNAMRVTSSQQHAQ